MSKKQFETGQILFTRTVLENDPDAAMTALARHIRCDWKHMDKYDRKANERAVKHGDERIFSWYKVGGVKLYVITEADRSATTVLYPSEY